MGGAGTAKTIDVFVSYSTHDADFAHRATHALREAGLRVWIAPDDIPAGASYPAEIAKALDASRVVLVFLTPAANASPHVAREVDHAVSCNTPVVPVRLTETLPEGDLAHLLRLSQWVDLFAGKPDERAAQLVRHVQRALGMEAPPPKPRAPSKGARRLVLLSLAVALLVVAGAIISGKIATPLGSDAIRTPAEGAVVDQEVVARGTAGPPRNRTLYLVVRTLEPSRYYPQDPALETDWRGAWSARVFFGAARDSGARFQLLLVEAGPSRGIEAYLDEARERGSWDGMEALPDDTRLLDTVGVIRK